MDESKREMNRKRSLAWYYAHQDEAKGKSLAWNNANKERAKENNRRWYEKNKDRVAEKRAGRKEQLTAYREKIKDSVKASRDKWKENNKELIKESSARWKATHPELVRIQSHRRRALKNRNGGNLSPDIYSRLFLLQRGKCSICKINLKKTGHHLDHIVPLSRGGENSDKNVQLTCPTCNVKKGNKEPIAFMQGLGMLL